MITSERDRKTREKYSARDKNDKVRCCDCPLGKGNWRSYDFRCKANSHYDRKTNDWEWDEDE